MVLSGKVLKNQKVLTNLVYLTSNFSSDDNKLVEFFRIHMLFNPLQLILVLQLCTRSTHQNRPEVSTKDWGG